VSAKAYVLEFGPSVSGGLRVPGIDTLIACAAITVSVDSPQSPR